jgi:hypothetical protein
MMVGSNGLEIAVVAAANVFSRFDAVVDVDGRNSE